MSRSILSSCALVTGAEVDLRGGMGKKGTNTTPVGDKIQNGNRCRFGKSLLPNGQEAVPVASRSSTKVTMMALGPVEPAAEIDLVGEVVGVVLAGKGCTNVTLRLF